MIWDFEEEMEVAVEKQGVERSWLSEGSICWDLR